jgi:hypothetical protein
MNIQIICYNITKTTRIKSLLVVFGLKTKSDTLQNWHMSSRFDEKTIKYKDNIKL